MVDRIDHIEYRSGFKYQLATTYEFATGSATNPLTTEFIDMDASGLLTIRHGYAWDGPSGPTFDTASAMRGSLVHDALYQLLRMKLLEPVWRHRADEIFYKLCLEDGMWKIRAWYFKKGVDMFAAGAARASARKRTIFAPKAQPNG